MAAPVPYYGYLCTITEPVRSQTSYLPPDNVCDYLFYDSLYKNGKNSLIAGFNKLEGGVQYFIGQASKYNKTKFGFSFAPE